MRWLVPGTWQALSVSILTIPIQLFKSYKAWVCLSFLVFSFPTIEEIWLYLGFPCLKQWSSLHGDRDHLIVDFDHTFISSNADSIIHSSLKLQMPIEPFCVLGTESLLQTMWKEMAICYLIYTLYLGGKYWVLPGVSLSFMDICKHSFFNVLENRSPWQCFST